MVKLEVGGFYKSRVGEKVGPIGYSGDGDWPFFCDNFTYRHNGGQAYFESDESDADLIAEWTEAPAEVIGENVRVIPINEAPDALFERMAETRCKPYDAPRSKYHRIIKGVEVDIYDILVAWGVTCPARQHAIKKLFMAGERGAKGVVQDLDEAIQATERAKELVG